MTGLRPPWEIVETFPRSDVELIEHWQRCVESANDDSTRIRALVGRALSLYWAVQSGVADEGVVSIARRRTADTHEAAELARRTGRADDLATALLGMLYARWGPDNPGRHDVVAELAELRHVVADEELGLRISEWQVLEAFDRGRLDVVRDAVEEFTAAARSTDLVLFHRREMLWRSNLAMLEGRIDESVAINVEAVSSTADIAGAPFSYQNVAITGAVAAFLRRQLSDVVESVRSIQRGLARELAANWDAGLCFTLAEIGEHDEARTLFDDLADDGFRAVPRDLNWLVTMTLLGLVSITLDDVDRSSELYALLEPFGALDATHGSGYASYGPVGRVVGALAARSGLDADAERWFGLVLDTRAPGPWTALTRLDRARARLDRSRDFPGGTADIRDIDSEDIPTEAIHTDSIRTDSIRTDAGDAEAELRRYGLDAWADDAAELVRVLRLAGHGGPVACLTDVGWLLRHGAGRAVVPDGVGVRHLVSLLARPGEVFDVLDLDPIVDPTLPAGSIAESAVDKRARAAYRRRLGELEQDSAADAAERLFLLRELAGARHVRSVSAEVERARVRVTKALHRAIDAVSDTSPGLGAHLRETIVTGRSCLYQPADGAAWVVQRR